MKKGIALLFAVTSGLYLLLWGPMVGPLDPVPIIDEAAALLIFVKAMSALGFDIARFLPFFGKKVPKEATKGPGSGPVVDV